MNAFIVIPRKPERWYEIHRLVEEASKLKITIHTYRYSDFQFVFKQGRVRLYYGGKSVRWSEYRFGILFASSSSGINYSETKLGLFQALPDLKILNRISLQTFPRLSKLAQYQMMARHKLPLVESLVDSSGAGYARMAKPFVLKKTVSSGMGKAVHLIKTKGQLDEILQRYKADETMAQAYIPGEEDLRVLVLGGRVLGVMKRRAKRGKFLTNISQGGRAEVMKVTPEIQSLALKLMSVFALEFAGLDLIYDKKQRKYLVLEVNWHAQFRGFEKVTGVNVAGEIVSYLASEGGRGQK